MPRPRSRFVSRFPALAPGLSLGLALVLAGCAPASGGRSGRDGPDGVRYHVRDRLGSSALVLDGEGGVVARQARRPYGEPWVDWRRSGETVSYAWTGMEGDPSGSVSVGVRHFVPGLGRWASPDPLITHEEPGFALAQTAERNPYVYGANNPVDRVDEDGRVGVLAAMAAGAIVGAAVETAAQLVSNGGDFSKLDARKIGTSAVAGGLTGPLAGARGAVMAAKAGVAAVKTYVDDVDGTATATDYAMAMASAQISVGSARAVTPKGLVRATDSALGEEIATKVGEATLQTAASSVGDSATEAGGSGWF